MMAPVASEPALRDLEHSTLPPLQLIDLVQNILGLDLLDLGHKYETSPDYESPTLPFAPREEWIFRWCIKKLDSAANPSSSPNSPGAEFILSKNVWLLLLHLTEIVPSDNVARILHEREFLPKLIDILSTVLRCGKAVDLRRTSPSLEQDEGQPRKRRKLSPPNTLETKSASSLPSTILPNLSIIICRATCALVAPGRTSPTQMQTLRLVPDKAAQLASLLLEIVLLGLRHFGSSDLRDERRSAALLRSVSSIVRLWDTSSHLSTDLIATEKSDLYHVHCCKVSCALINFLTEDAIQDTQRRKIRKHLEYMLSLHSILPLRSALNDKLKSGSISDNIALTWNSFEPVYMLVSQHFNMITDNLLHLEPDEHSNETSEFASTLLDVALLSIPSGDIRRRQREQPWLENLFLSLTYLSCPSLPKIKDTSDRSLHGKEGDRSPLRSIVDVECLIDIVLERKFGISLAALSYLTSAILAAEDVENPWLCLAKILQIDQNVLIPNSGFKSAEHCLHSVLQRIRMSPPKSEDHYEIVRDHIVLPLISGFAQARDLHGFVTIWQIGLEDAIALRVLEDDEDVSNKRMGLVWDDEDIFDAFKSVARVHALPSSSRVLLAKAIEEIRSLQTRVGSCKDVFSQLAILDAFLACRQQDFSAARVDVKNLLDAIKSALAVHSTYQSQRWRLWSISRRCLLLLADSNLADDHLQSEGSPLRPIRLTSVMEALKTDGISTRRVDFKEALECFHLLVGQLTDLQFETEGLLRSEVVQIGSLLTLLSRSSKSSSTEKPKTGSPNPHSNIMGNALTFAQACVGILCQNPKSLLNSKSATSALLVSLCDYCKYSEGKQNGLLFSNIMEAVISLDEIGCSGPLYQQCFKILAESIKEDEKIPAFVSESLHQIPLKSIHRSLLQSLAASIDVKLRLTNSSSSKDMVAELGLLEKLDKSTTIQLSKPENWKQLVDLADSIGARVAMQSSKEYQISARCIRSLFSSLWQRMIVLDSSEKNKRLVAEMLSWCTEKLDGEPHFRYGLSSFVILRGLMDGFWNSKDAPLLEPSGKNFTSLRKIYFANLVKDLRHLTTADVDDQDLPFALSHIVQALSECRDLCEGSDELRSATTLVNGAIVHWKETRSTEIIPSIDFASILESSGIQLNKFTSFSDHSDRYETPMVEKLDKIMQAAPDVSLGPTPERLRWTIENITNLPANDRVQFLPLLEDILCPVSVRAELAGAIAYGTTQAELQSMPPLAQRLNDVVTLRFAVGAESPKEICLALESVKMILQYHPGVVNQWAVDNLLSSVALIAGPSVALTRAEPQAEFKDGVRHAIFDRLCDILGILLARFRRRLQGRYHLLLPATQNLVRCLFYSGSASFDSSQSRSQIQIQFVESVPLWMRDSFQDLSPSSARKFGRVLSAICDPTTSSVKSSSRHPRSKAELTDETKKAQRTAGHYMQHLIIEYAKCSLEGQIKPEVKEKLMPGLYAVLDAMPTELMRAMNAVMDASSRAIFKGLYDDYQKFGKWNKN